jgi:glutamine synthetase
VSEAVYTEFKSSLVTGEALSKQCKQELTDALKKWALSEGCTYMAHMFTPLRTREGRVHPGFKYDSLVDLDFTSKDVLKPVEGDWLSPTAMFQSETDGSSFPNGGIRMTHRAAAFLSWDKRSPPFIMRGCMYLPAAFVTHNGEALDHKTPLLRAEDAVNREALRLLRNLGEKEATQVVSNLGWEQEYFLVSRDVYEARPDLINCGRTLFGAMAPRNQEGSENYFAPPYPLAKQFMEEVCVKACPLRSLPPLPLRASRLSFFRRATPASQDDHLPRPAHPDQGEPQRGGTVPARALARLQREQRERGHEHGGA